MEEYVFSLKSVEKNHISGGEAKWDVVTVKSHVWHMCENAPVYSPLHPCCARTKHDGCSGLTELSRKRSETLSCCAYSMAEEDQPCSVQCSMLFLAFQKISRGNKITHKFTGKQNKLKHFSFFLHNNLTWKETGFLILSEARYFFPDHHKTKLWALSIQKDLCF